MNLLTEVKRFHFPATFRLRPVVLGLGVCIWCCAIATGSVLLLQYKSQSGDRGTPPSNWPSEISLSHSPNRQTLLVFSHPHCPCTRATFRELERIVSQGTDGVEVHIIFVGLDGVAGSAENTRLSSAVSHLGFAQVHYDNGELGKRFHVRTSGHVLLYDREGQLQFNGGITASRGHEGTSIGSGAIAALLLGQPTESSTAAVYGCPMFSVQPNCDEHSCAVASKGS